MRSGRPLDDCLQLVPVAVGDVEAPHVRDDLGELQPGHLDEFLGIVLAVTALGIEIARPREHLVDRSDVGEDLAHVLVGVIDVAEVPVPSLPEDTAAELCPLHRLQLNSALALSLV